MVATGIIRSTGLLQPVRSLRFWPYHFLLGQTNFSQGTNKIPFYTKQAINKSAMVILALLGLLYYSTVNREAVSRVGKLSVSHAHDLFQCSEGRKLSYKQNASVVFKSVRLQTLN